MRQFKELEKVMKAMEMKEIKETKKMKQTKEMKMANQMKQAKEMKCLSIQTYFQRLKYNLLYLSLLYFFLHLDQGRCPR